MAHTEGRLIMDPEQEEHDFTLVIDRPITEDETDRLFETTAGDATPERTTQRTLLHFVREAPSLAVAIASAVLDVEQAGLTTAGVGSNDLVDLSEIATRVGRSHESVRLLAAGKRGTGGFPAVQNGLYSWALVRAWFAGYDPEAVGSPTEDQLVYDRMIVAADHVVRARSLTHGQAGGLAALLSA